MRLSILAIFTALSSTVMTDSLTVDTWCLFGFCHSDHGTWHTPFDTFSVEADEGCRRNDRLRMLCVDWENQRGHFIFYSEGWKRCIRMSSRMDLNRSLNCGGLVDCDRSEWVEVICDW